MADWEQLIKSRTFVRNPPSPLYIPSYSGRIADQPLSRYNTVDVMHIRYLKAHGSNPGTAKLSIQRIPLSISGA